MDLLIGEGLGFERRSSSFLMGSSGL